MNVSQKLIKLSRSEAEYLRQSSFLPPALATIVKAASSASNGSVSLHLFPEVAEQFRSALTDQLAKCGFDVDYELTNEGRLLEDLIDRFSVGAGNLS